jgi:16S rRNA (cytidine1402-2'-O)-methyltransferase
MSQSSQLPRPSSKSDEGEPSRAADAPQQPGEAPRTLPAGLYVVATPIGNLGDITLRALETLRGAEVIACEDTRVTGKLLAAKGIERPMLSYHEHNAAQRRPEIVRRIEAGAAVALVSDAGTPLISDPGYKLVRAVQDAGGRVTALPGASAAMAALVVSGLPSDRFFFQGFLPAKSKARRDVLAELKDLKATLIVYESPKRLRASLRDMAEVLGTREAAVTRELTKRFEEVRRAPLDVLADDYETPPKGEIAVVVAPPDAADSRVDAQAVDAWIRDALETMSVRDAAVQVARNSGWPRKQVYTRALEIKAESGS